VILVGMRSRSRQLALGLTEFRVHRDVPALRTRRLLAELERSWREVRERARFRIVHYSVQGNHVHLLVEAASARDLTAGLKSVVARFARAVEGWAGTPERAVDWPAVAAARTWLLSRGWRRHGLIRRDEVPRGQGSHGRRL
jgi:REP element-mobilizing transposase RayT